MAKKKERSPGKGRDAGSPARPAKLTIEWRPHVFAILTVLALTLVAYSNSFSPDLSLDSRVVIGGDPRIRAVTTENLGLIWSRGYWYGNQDPTLYRPFTTLSYLLNYAVLGNGVNAAGYHWVNFILHAIVALLVYSLGLAVFRGTSKALALAALWTVHPVLTESVTYIVGRADVLASLGVLAGLLCHVKAAPATGVRKAAWLMGLAAASAIGIFSKESAVVLIALMLVYDLAFRRSDWQAATAGYAAAALPVALFLWQRWRVLSTLPVHVTGFGDNPLVGMSFWKGRLTAIQVTGRYIGSILWPRNLSCDYSYNQIPLFRGTFDGWGDWATLLAVLTCLAAAALAAASYRRRPSVFFLIALFFIALAPVANIALLVGTIRADRFLYLPAAGFIGCAVWAIHAAVERLNTIWPGSPITPTWVLGLLCLALVVRTYARNSDWENSQTLFESAALVSPRSYKAHLNLAGSLYDNLDHAIAEGERSLAILKSLPPDKDEDAAAYGEIASIYLAKGDTLRQGEPPGSAAMSGQWYQKALEILLHGAAVDREHSAKLERLNREAGRPPQGFGTPGVYRELGTVYLRLGEPQKAMEAAEYGSFLNPDGEIFHIMSEAYTALHDRNNAAIALMEGLLVQPDRAGGAAELVALYQQEPSGCAVNQDGLNLDCPQVHDDLCTAARRTGDLFDRRGQRGVAERARDTAVRRFGCPPQ